MNEDLHLLRVAGRFGHRYVGIYGGPGHRSLRCEANSLDGVRTAFYRSDVWPTVYQRVAARRWARVWVGELQVAGASW